MSDCTTILNKATRSNWAEATSLQEMTIIEGDAEIKCSYLLSAILCQEKRGYGMSSK